MTGKRNKSIEKSPKKVSMRTIAITILSLLVVLSILTACTAPTATLTPSPMLIVPTAEPIVYKNEVLGFSLSIPADWKDKYAIKALGESVTFYSKSLYENEQYKGMGRLFTIERHIGELFTQEDMGLIVPEELLLCGNGYSYSVRLPSDVQYPTEDSALSDEYKALYSKRAYRSIELLGTKTPEPSNAGYKVIGGASFTAEIPKEWDIKALENAVMSWNLYSSGSVIGSISEIPYGSEKLPNDDKVIREYFNSRNNNIVKLELSLKSADQSVMVKIKSSYKSFGYPGTSVNLQSEANRCLENGGTKFFGKLGDFAKGDGYQPASVSVRLMEYVPDKGEKGYHIEDQNKTVTFPAGYILYAPLVGPDYKHLGTYNVASIDMRYIDKQYPKYKDFYYDFILADGKIKYIIARYFLP